MRPLPKSDDNPLHKVPPFGEMTSVLIARSKQGGCVFYVPTNSDSEALDVILKTNLELYLDAQDFGNTIPDNY